LYNRYHETNPGSHFAFGRECEQHSRMQELVPGISDTDPTAAGLLIECRARSDKALDVPSPPPLLLHPSRCVSREGSLLRSLSNC